MIIDEARTHVLTKYSSTKGGQRKVESDHNLLIGRFSISYRKINVKTVRETFNFKNSLCQSKFLEVTNNTSKFTSCFDAKTINIESMSAKFFKSMNETFYQCFDKIRITNKPGGQSSNVELQNYMNLSVKLKNFLKSNKSPFSKRFVETKIDQLNTKISSLISSKNCEIVTNQISNLETLEGGFSQNGMWRVKSKLFPKPPNPPMAKRDNFGNLITTEAPLKNLYLETYVQRLKQRKIKEEFEEIYMLKTLLWNVRLNQVKTKITKNWNESDLDKVLKTLKKNQSIDPNNMINKIFLPSAMGSNLKSGLIILMNEIKSEMVIPFNLQLAKISSIYKNKGSKFDLQNDRGIFILPVVRKMLDKLLYQDKYSYIDSAMSDSNNGARRDKNIKNHLFVLYGIINSVLKE